MIQIPANVYDGVCSQIGHVIDGKVVVDNTTIPEVRNKLSNIMKQAGCNVPIDLMFKVMALGDTVIIQMYV